MQSLNPTRIVQRRGREVMIIGAFVLIFGLMACGCSLVLFLLPIFSSSSNIIGIGLIPIGSLIVLAGIVTAARGLRYRLQNQHPHEPAHTLYAGVDEQF